METKIDAAGRIVVPKPLRDALGLSAGTTVDISAYGAGLAVVPGGRVARLVDEDGHMVLDVGRPVTDAETFALIDASRR